MSDSQIEFEGDGLARRQVYTTEKTGFSFARMLVAKGILRDEAVANKVLMFLALLCLAIAGFIVIRSFSSSGPSVPRSVQDEVMRRSMENARVVQ